MFLGKVFNNCFCVYENGKVLKSIVDMREVHEAFRNFYLYCPAAADSTIWFDASGRRYFSPEQYRETVFGKDHSFCSDKRDFIQGKWGKSLVENIISKFDIETLKNQETIYNQEWIFSKPQHLEKYEGKSVLIVSGGPSTKDVDWQNIKTDFIWSCNNFFLDSRFQDVDIDLITLAPNVDFLNNEKLESYLKNKNTKVAFEIERGDFSKDYRNMKDFISKHPDACSFFHTRYRGQPGVSLRMLCYAIALGVKDIYFVGIDGFKQNSSGHAFEANKKNPNWFQEFGASFQNRQYAAYWNYILNLQKEHNFNLYNLGECHEYNVSTEFSTEFFPLNDNIKHKLNLSKSFDHKSTFAVDSTFDITPVDYKKDELHKDLHVYAPKTFQPISDKGTVVWNPFGRPESEK